MGSSVRALVLCVVAALTACGGGGGSAPATSAGAGLVVSWVSRSGPSGGSGTQADAIHLASPSYGVFVTASRGGVAQRFNLTADPACTAVSVGSGSSNFSVSDPNAPPPVTIVPFGPGTWDVTWTIVSANKGTCTVTVTTFDGAKATLQVFSGL